MCACTLGRNSIFSNLKRTIRFVWECSHKLALGPFHMRWISFSGDRSVGLHWAGKWQVPVSAYWAGWDLSEPLWFLWRDLTNGQHVCFHPISSNPPTCIAIRLSCLDGRCVRLLTALKLTGGSEQACVKGALDNRSIFIYFFKERIMWKGLKPRLKPHTHY